MHRIVELAWPRHRQTKESLAPTAEQPDLAATEAPTQSPATMSWVVAATVGFAVLGLAVRLIRYLVDYPLWPDEAFVAANFLERGYLELIRSLDYGQVCPFLFLWIELTVVRLLGFAEWSLRLFPILCSLASMIVFYHLATRLLNGVSLLLAVGIFATALAPIRHGAEVKPYASDLLSALILLTLAVEWLRDPDRGRMWWALTALAPILLGLSYTAIFVATGLSLTLAHEVFQRRHRGVKWAFLAYNGVMACSFVVIYLLATASQSAAVRAGYRWGYWRDSFPPWAQPWRLPIWLVSTHAGNMLAYPIGGANGASIATLIAVIVGVVALRRDRRNSTAYLLVSPFVMGLAASILGLYPYGGSARIMQYIAPSVCILSGLGFSVMIARIRSAARRQRAVPVAGVLLALLGVYFIFSDLVRPYRAIEDWENRRFARWFWSEKGRDRAILCIRGDLGLLRHPRYWHTGMSAVYRCHQRIYSKGRQLGTPAQLVPPDRSFGVVFFDQVPAANPEWEEWLAKIGETHVVCDQRAFEPNPGLPAADRGQYILLEFTPRRETKRLARALGGGGGIRSSH